MPAEQLARPDHSDHCDPISSSRMDARDLTKRHRHTERARGARQAHGFQRVLRRRLVSAHGRLLHFLRGEQRAFDLHEMHVGRIVDLRVLHGGGDAFGDGLDLSRASEMLGRQRRSVCAADRERGRCTAVALDPLENRPMRRHAAFGAARHHEANLIRLILRDMAREELAERERRVTAGEIVDAAIAFGLSENGDDGAGIDSACVHGRFDPAHIIRRGGGNSMNSCDGHVETFSSNARAVRNAAPSRDRARASRRRAARRLSCRRASCPALARGRRADRRRGLFRL